MTKEIPHAALVASLDADGLALLSAALDERHSREELGFGTFAGAAVRGQEVALREPMGRGSPPPHRRGVRQLKGQLTRVGPLHPPDEAQRAPGLRGGAVRSQPPDGLRVAPQDARHRLGPPGARRAARPRLDRRETYVNDTDLSKGYG